MSRIDELKKQHPNYALSIIDIFKMISPNQSSKYIEMLIKLDKNREFNEPDAYRRQIIECMVGWGIDYNYLETFDLETLNMFFINVNNLVGDTGKIRSFTKFASLNERKLIAKELLRHKEFALISNNKQQAIERINDVANEYGINLDQLNYDYINNLS